MIDEISKSYSIALLDSISDSKSKYSYQDCLDELQLIYKIVSDEKINKFLNHPNIELSEKQGLLKNALTKFNKIVVSFIMVLIENKAINRLDDIIKSISSIIDDKNGIVRVEIVSNYELEKNTFDKIVKSLEINYNKKVIATKIIDSSIIGGIIVKKDGYIIDDSILAKLNAIKNSILDN